MKVVIAALGALALSAPAYADIFVVGHHHGPSMAASGLLAAVAGGVLWMKRRG